MTTGDLNGPGSAATLRTIAAVRLAARARTEIVTAVLDAALIAGTYTLLMALRTDGAASPGQWAEFRHMLPLVVAVTLASVAAFGLYGQVWRHASILEARRLLLAGSSAVPLVLACSLGHRSGIPLSLVVTGPVGSTLILGAIRFRSRLFARQRPAVDAPIRIAVLGAGEGGAALVRDMRRDPRSELLPVAVLDDDRRKHGRSLLGVSVSGPLERLTDLARRLDVHQAVLAIPSADQALVQRAAALAESAGIPLRVVPPVRDLLDGVTVRSIRELRIEDLLGREPVDTDLHAVKSLLTGRRVLITGAGGSIGSEIARQVAAFQPSALLLLDHDETHLHDAAASLGAEATLLLADIRQRDRVLQIFRRHRPEVVFHAAAHKHVPMLEEHPSEAVQTNVVGTDNVVAAALAVAVERFVFVSTDKAVRPSSVMGATKRLGEHLVLSAGSGAGLYCAVRFGNVLGSRGSVIPTFLRQIDAGGPLTVTDSRMTRFFMSIPEAVQLVLQAAALAEGSEIFMLEMGEPVRILDLATRMVRLAGRQVGEDIEVRVTGVRPGEKLEEELHAPDEATLPTSHPSIVRIRPSLDGWSALAERLRGLAALADADHDEDLRRTLFDLVHGGVQQPASAVPPGPRVIDLTESAAWSPSTT